MDARFENLCITWTGASPNNNSALRSNGNGATPRSAESVRGVQPVTSAPDSCQETTTNQAPQSVFERLYQRERVASMKFKERIHKNNGNDDHRAKRSPKFANANSTPRSVVDRAAASTSKKRTLQQQTPRAHSSKKARSLEVKKSNPQASAANVVSQDSGEANNAISSPTFPLASRGLKSTFDSEYSTPPPLVVRTPLCQTNLDRSSTEKKPGSQSFFDRLASTDTFASARLKERKPAVVEKKRITKPQPLYSTSLRRPLGAPITVYERLANANTASSRGRQTSPYHSPVPMNIDTTGFIKRANPQSDLLGPVFHSLTVTTSLTPTTTQQQRNWKSPRPMNNTSRVKLLLSDQNNPEQGFRILSPHEIGIDGHLHMYEAGDLTSSGIARSIMEALFHRDFKAGKHWDVECAKVCPLKEEDDVVGEAYAAEKTAIWDRIDIRSTAQAKGIVRIMPDLDEIRIEHYSYIVS